MEWNKDSIDIIVQDKINNYMTFINTLRANNINENAVWDLEKKLQIWKEIHWLLTDEFYFEQVLSGINFPEEGWRNDPM